MSIAQGAVNMFRRVLLCFDGSKEGRRALQRGAELTVLVKAQVHVLLIIPNAVQNATLLARATGHDACLVDVEGDLRRLLNESVDSLRACGLVAKAHLARGKMIDEIVAHSSKLGIDLIVLGHYPRESGGFWWSGPKRASLADRVKCCVLIAEDSPVRDWRVFPPTVADR